MSSEAAERLARMQAIEPKNADAAGGARRGRTYLTPTLS
jgi:hypothetical protein